jgi:threonine/homoserine/homoserine lactone efflux protein
MVVDSTEFALFTVEILGLLTIPGPTNSLLFVSGITRGFRSNLNLVLAVVGAYVISISLLLFILEPVTSTHPLLPQALRIFCGIYLLHVAVRLWQSEGRAALPHQVITFHQVFVATLLNPKNFIFAFGIFPVPSAGFSDTLPYLAGFSVICPGVAFSWIAAGALLQSKIARRIQLPWLYRGEAFLLAGFAIVIFASAYY